MLNKKKISDFSCLLRFVRDPVFGGVMARISPTPRSHGRLAGSYVRLGASIQPLHPVTSLYRPSKNLFRG